MRRIPAHPFVPRRRSGPFGFAGGSVGAALLGRAVDLVRRFGLPTWFGIWTIADCHHRLGEFFASDTRIYVRGAAAFLEGRDPWAAAVGPFHFAGLPPTVQLFVPMALLPEHVAVALGFGVALLSAIAIVRTLGLPWWWLLFPPLAHGVVVTNPHVLLTALLITNRGWAEALAALLKVYAVVPLAGRFRWRGLILAAGGFGVSFVLAPGLWLGYVATMAETTVRLNEEAAGGFSAAIVPTLLGPMALLILMLWLIDRRAGSWLAVPALWPASQFFTQTFVLPLFARVPGGHTAPGWFAALLAIPSRGVVPLAVMLYVLARLWSSRQLAIAERRAKIGPSVRAAEPA